MPSFIQKYQALVEAKETELLVESIKNAVREVNSSNEHKITEEELNNLIESVCQDEQLLLEFLGGLAGFLGKALGGAGSKLNKYSAQQSKIAQRKASKKELLKTKKDSRNAHSVAIQNYAKALKSGDPAGRSAAYKAMKDAQVASLKSRGITLNKPMGKGAYTNKRGVTTVQNKVHKNYMRKFGIKEFIEMVKLAQQVLNEGSLGMKRTERLQQSKKMKPHDQVRALVKNLDKDIFRANRKKKEKKVTPG